MTNYGSVSTSRETTRLLAESVSLAHNSEEIGLSIGENMRSQREHLHDSQNTLRKMRNLSKSAADSIKEIENKSRRRKFWLWCFIIILFCANLILIGKMWHNAFGSRNINKENLSNHQNQ